MIKRTSTFRVNAFQIVVSSIKIAAHAERWHKPFDTFSLLSEHSVYIGRYSVLFAVSLVGYNKVRMLDHIQDVAALS